MPRYRLKANAWYANTEIDFGVYEFDTGEEAHEAAFDNAVERIGAWAELIEDEE